MSKRNNHGCAVRIKKKAIIIAEIKAELNHGRTFNEICVDYNYSEEDFIEHIKERMFNKDKEFRAMKRQNELNMRNRRRVERREFNPNLVSINPALDADSTHEKEGLKNMKNIKEALEQKNVEKETAERKASEIRSNITILKSKLAIQQDVLVQTRAVYNEAMKALQEAEKEVEEIQCKISEETQNAEDFEKQATEISHQIEELENSRIYLVSPMGYTGEVPLFGKFISVIEKVPGFSGNLEVKNAELLMEGRIEEMEAIGVDSLKTYNLLIKFVSLYTEYWLDDIQVEILSDTDMEMQLFNLKTDE